VDQSIDPKEPNFGILPLPNLETKIVAANTLLGLQRGQLLLGSDEVRRLEKQLQRVRHDYFTSRRYKDKKALRARDRELSTGLAKALSESLECTPHDSGRLAAWNPYDANTAASFFDPGWMFGLPVPEGNDNGVFDIVIGNPPYVRQEELKNIIVTGSDGKAQPLKEALKGQYETFTGTADLYVYFFERSLQLLRTGGVLSFITSNKYFRAGYGERLRTYIAFATNPRVILDFGDAPLFTSVAYPAILVTQKTRHVKKDQLPSLRGLTGILHPSNLPPEDWQSQALTWSPGPALSDFPEIFEQQASALAQRDLKPDGWKLESPVKLRLLEGICKGGTPLGEYVQGRLYRGITTGLNEAFIVDRATRDRFIRENPSSRDILKPFLRGRDLNRWRFESQDIWLIFTRRGIDIKKYTAIHEHLKQFKKALMPGIPGGRKPGSYEWYEIQDNTAYWQEFQQPKVVFPDIAVSSEFTWDNDNHYLANTAYLLIADKWLLSILNSTIVLWFYTQISNAIRGGYLRFIRQYVEQIPIPLATPDQQRWCVRLAQALIWLNRPEAKAAKKGSLDLILAYFEQWVNGLVYELFFPGELQARKLKLFNETARLNPPDLEKLPESRKLGVLQDVFTKAYDANGTLRGMLFDLPSLEVVRVIEEVPNAKAERPIEEEA
jgi:hypothetical protein